MILTKSQIAQLSKWAKSGRLIVRPITGDALPEWAKHEFNLARNMVQLLVEYSNSGEMEAKSMERRKRYTAGNRKAWVTRKRQKQAREAAASAEAEARKIGEAA